MRLSTSQQTILSLLRTAVTGESVAVSLGVNWQEVMDLAIRQGVLGLAFDGLAKLKESSGNPFEAVEGMSFETYLVWLGQVECMEERYRHHRNAVAYLAQFYGNHGIRMLLMKGYGLSLFWPTAEHRPTGDIDCYTFDDHDRADQLVMGQGVEIDNSHHKHSVFALGDVTVEHHYSFLNTHGHWSTAEIEKILKNCIGEIPDNAIVNLYYPSTRFNSLYLLRHSAEHFASVEMSLRVVLDWAFFVRACHPDWDWLLEKLDSVGMKQYLAVLNAICIQYLGFDASLFPQLPVDNNVVDRCLLDILSPEVESEKHNNIITEVAFRTRRWWKNRWKHDLVFKESQVQSFVTQVWSHVLKPKL